MALRAFLVWAGVAGAVLGQAPAPRPPERRYYKPEMVPSQVRGILTALGQRVQASGLERLVVAGTLRKGNATSAMRVIREGPGQLRVDETGGGGRVLAFDGRDLAGLAAVGEDEEDLVEALDGDSAERFLQEVVSGTPTRWLGDRFRTPNATGFGAEVDVFELVLAVASRRDKQVRVKHFMFDTRSGLLRRVAYQARKGAGSVRVQTLYSDYSAAGGHMLPGKVERLENGAVVFSFTRESAQLAPGANDGAFRLR